MASSGIAGTLIQSARRLRGGVVLPRHKEAVEGQPSRALPLPTRLVYPLRAHVGLPAMPVVRVGQRVLKGERIAAPESYVSQAIHAASSGVVLAIDERPVAHASGEPDTCIVIEVDGEDRAVDPWPALDYETQPPAALQARIVEAGIVGMGGAGFPSHVKLREGMGHAVDVLIVNGVECEPYINCDDCLMRERPAAVIAGARILRRAVQARSCILAIEEEMAAAEEALEPFLDADITLARVPAVYPAGGEKQLVLALTGIEIPTHGLPIHCGVIAHNVATTVAVYDAVMAGLPLTERLITVSGSVTAAANVQARLGTAVSHLLDACGRTRPLARLILGGPMMGTAVHEDTVPVGKTTNCVLAIAEMPALPPVRPCIRCGECVDACPAGLQPQALYEFTRARDWDSAQDWYLFDCIECGVCAYVCPSALPLVHHYRYAKSEIEALERAGSRASELRGRFNARQQRQEAARNGGAEAESAARRAANEALKTELAAAIERGRAKRRKPRDGQDDPSEERSGTDPTR